MELPGFRFRYINYACYELVIPNEKEIVIDPCIDFSGKSESFSQSDYRGADYIILSHTHYDHTMDVEYLYRKFKSKVIVGSMSCEALLNYYDINFDNIYPIQNNEFYDFPDFKLETFRSKHTFMNNPDSVMSKMKEGIGDFPKGHTRADIMGFIEYFDYLITTNNNIRIFISGGGPNKFFYNNISKSIENKNPNIIFKQLSSKYTPEEFAETVAVFHPQLVLPLHQDGILRKTEMTIDEYTNRVNKHLHDIASPTLMINPNPYKWYSISMKIINE